MVDELFDWNGGLQRLNDDYSNGHRHIESPCLTPPSTSFTCYAILFDDVYEKKIVKKQ